MYNIVDFGAVPDGKTINTEAIQKALDSCPVGDAVYIPMGIFLSGALFLRSGANLILANGAVLKGSSNKEDYPPYKYRFEGTEQLCYSSLINTFDGEHSNIEISGYGTIDGSGIELYEDGYLEGPYVRGRVICIRNTHNVQVSGITICNSVAWTLHLIYCDNINISSVRIFSRQSSDFSYQNERLKNGDGIAIDSCSHVEIQDSIIDSQDDCITIKSGKNEEGRRIGLPSRQIYIHNNNFYGGAGISIGSEMSGGIMDVNVEECSSINVLSLMSIKTNRERGGFIRNITVKNCNLMNYDAKMPRMANYKSAIYIDGYYKTHEENWTEEGIPSVSNITFDRIFMINKFGKFLYLRGIPGYSMKNVVFQNIEAVCVGDPEIADASVTFNNVTNNGQLVL